MANAIVGSLIVTSLGASFAIPIGIMSGVYTSIRGRTPRQHCPFRRRYAQRRAFHRHRRLRVGCAVLPFQQFSAMAGGVALGIMMIPLIMRTTEELLRLVPER